MAYKLVVIGTSLGGLSALETILMSLPSAFPLPIAVVQHRMPDARSRMIPLLQMYTGLKVREPHDKDPVLPGHVYIAPADYHLMVDDFVFNLSTDAPILSARPSIDALFESAADVYGDGVIGVVLTGASADGSAGARRIKERGGSVMVQDPKSAESGVMPRAAIASTNPDWVVPLSEVGPLLASITMKARSDGHADGR